MSNVYNVLGVLAEKKIYAAGTARVCRFAKPPLMNNKEMAKKLWNLNFSDRFLFNPRLHLLSKEIGLVPNYWITTFKGLPSPSWEC
ncbi:hypothetical protein AAFF_G00115400 [Aldrovandia affinis]|uniref:Uncharacterized protein n=1 Tax=Aldrovandia affinis TaxID=143900 RepID=A0AAD7RSP4_9TELE|nr:hypothetical protein AAFF_G00115400 [Aldrovandia affinis]